MDEEDRKATIYVGGFSEDVTDRILHAAFIPFGEISHIQIPIDQLTEKHRGFGFLEYEEPGDAEAAIDNMDRSELGGRIIHVNQAKPVKFTDKNKPVWAQTDAYIQELESDKQRREDEEKKVKEQRQQEVEAHAKVPQGPTLPNLGVQNRLK